MNKNKYSTQSISLATALCSASKSKLLKISFSGNTKRADFIFNHDDPNLEEIINLFWQKKLPIDASTYFEQLRLIKSRLYEEKMNATR